MKNYIILASITILSNLFQFCTQKKENTPKHLKEYCTIIFESKNKKIYISDDYSFSEEWVKQKKGEHTKIQKKLNFTKSERDSVAMYAYRVITNPTIANTVMTCGAGENITIEISYCTTSISCNYSSIPSWSTLSTDNKKLYDILNAKTRIPN